MKEKKILPRVTENMLGEIPGSHSGAPGHRPPAEVMESQSRTQVPAGKAQVLNPRARDDVNSKDQ